VPVISIGLLFGERPPRAAPTDLVLVAVAAGFPVGLLADRPVRIDPLPPRGARPRDVVDLKQLRLTAAEADVHPDAEMRLASFERGLTAQARRRLEQRARRYGEFAMLRRPSAHAAVPSGL
jgi:hypothetical protein